MFHNIQNTKFREIGSCSRFHETLRNCVSPLAQHLLRKLRHNFMIDFTKLTPSLKVAQVRVLP